MFLIEKTYENLILFLKLEGGGNSGGTYYTGTFILNKNDSYKLTWDVIDGTTGVLINKNKITAQHKILEAKIIFL